MQKKISLLFIILVIICSTQAFSYIPLIRIPFWNTLVLLIDCILLFYLFFVKGSYGSKGINGCKLGVFKNSVLVIILSLILSVLPAYIEYHQSFQDSFKAISLLIVGYLFYFYLIKNSPSVASIEKILITFSLVYFFIELIQQFTYPSLLFSHRYVISDEIIEYRFGIYRFAIKGIDIVELSLLLVFYKYCEGKGNNCLYLVLTILFVGAIYMHGARKLLYVTIFSISAILFISKSQYRKRRIFFFLILFFVVISNYYSLYVSESIDLLEKQTEGDDFIRWLSAEYFIASFSDSALYPFWGAGIPWATSRLGAIIHSLADIGFYQADSGIIGYFSMLGIVGVIAILKLYFVILKNWRHIDLPYKMFFLIKIVLLVFDFWGIIQEGIVAMCIFLYLVEKNIQKNKIIHNECRCNNVSFGT